MLDEFIADLGNMDQPVLVDTQVYECAEINDVAHSAGQFHAGFEVVQPHDVTAQQRLGQAVAHVAARLTQLGDDIVQRRLTHPQRLTQDLGPLDLDNAGQARQLVGADFGGGVAAGIQQGLGGGVALGVDGGRVQAVLRLGQPQEARALLIRLGAKTLDLFQLRTGGERALFLTPGNDILGRGRADARHAAQQRRRGSVQVDADTVHAVLDHAVQRLVQPLLGHIVLVLAHADGLGVDLDQLGQRILQTAGNGHSAAQVNVILGEFLGGQFAGGVDRRAGLADDHILQMQVLFVGQLADDLGSEFLCLVAGRAVADGHDLDAVPQNHRFDNFFRLIHALELGHRVDDVRVQHLAGGVHDGDLAAHAVAGVQAHNRLAADGRL